IEKIIIRLDASAPGTDFDMMTALDWKDGIATLPGSDIRVQGFNDINLIISPSGQQAQAVGSVAVGTCPEEGTSTELGRCKTCGHSGSLSSFLQGKFCSPFVLQKSFLLLQHGEGGIVLMCWCDDAVAVVTTAPVKKKAWSWPAYLEEEKAVAAPLKLFKEHQSFPQSRNMFKVGMKLEGLDPCHPALFCVLTVAEVQGYRIRLHFDGYPECYDFWVNADSWDVKPPGWCEKMGLKLLLPKGCRDGEFNWNTYVKNCRGQLAPKHLFKSLNTSVTPSGFRAGMKLEAVDRKNPSLICVATISAVVDNRLLIHFDNWDDTYDYWCDASSPYIHPVGFCEDTELTLTTPAEYKQPKSFSWEKYLEETGSQAAPARAFKQRPPHGFQVGMKLESVDKRNPMLIRVSTISDLEDFRVKIHFDGWTEEYDYWADADSPDLHPVGWCQKTGHPLQHFNGSSSEPPAPPGQGCPTPGCNGVGHIKGPRYGTHYTAVSCPYSELNLNKEGLVPDRLSGERPVTLSGPPRHRRTESLNQTSAHTPTGNSLEPTENSLQQFLHDSVFCGWEPPKFQQCWEKHGKLLPEALGLNAKTVAKWNTEEVATFVRKLPGCREHATIFRNEQIDGEAFLLLTQSDIVKILSIKLGPALKIYNCILMLKSADEE
uniref:L3MBTL histone methyl-lysine binding protein 1b n=1 Tax=Astyanax mexicanus TaxID=7994 RepID=A0A8B9HL58_ASTMX